MAKKTLKIDRGVKLKKEDLTTTPITEQGELATDSTDNKLKYRDDVSTKEVVLDSATQTLTNKNIDADTNTLSNIETDNLKAGVLNTDLTGVATDTEIPSALAVKSALALQNEASEITYDNTTSGLTATDLQASTDEIEARLDTAETSIGTNATDLSNHIADAIDSHDASSISNIPAGNLVATDIQGAVDELQADVDTRATDVALTAHNTNVGDHSASVITNVPAGNLAATDVQAALDELQTDVDTRATSADLSLHEASTSTHGVTEVLGTSESQIITAKDIDGGTASDTSRITIPKADKAILDALTRKEGTIVYDSTAKKGYLDNGTDLVDIGSGSGSGGINYIENGDYDLNLDGTTGDTNLILTQEIIAPLRGDGSLNIAKGAIDASTQTIDIPFIIDKADLAKKLTITFDYDTSDANYVDDAMKIEIVKDPAGTPTIISVNGEDLKGGKNSHLAQFQTDATELNYALRITQVATTTTAVTILIDNVQVGPREVIKGIAGYDSKDYVPLFSGLGSVTGVEFSYSRVGDKLHGTGKVIAGTTTATEIQITLPPGLTIGSNGLASGVNISGTYIRNNGGTLNGGSVLSTIGDTFINITDLIWSGASYSAFNPALGNGVVASGNILSIEFTVPIQGWSSNAIMSEDVSGREIKIQYSGNGGEVITANTEDIPFANLDVVDTTLAWTNAGNTGSNTADAFTAPETGRYKVSGMMRITTTTVLDIGAYVNGSLDKKMGYNGSTNIAPFSGEVDLVKGDILTFRNTTTVTLLNNANYHWITISKLSTPQTILGTENLAAIYHSNSGQSVSAGTTMIYEDFFLDTHGRYDTVTGIYKVGEPRLLQINASIMTASVAWLNTDFLEISVRVNGVVSKAEFIRTQSHTQLYQVSISDIVDAKKGDEIVIAVTASRGATNTSASANYNKLSIVGV